MRNTLITAVAVCALGLPVFGQEAAPSAEPLQPDGLATESEAGPECEAAKDCLERAKGWGVAALDSARDLDKKVGRQFGAWRKSVVDWAREEARSVEFRRGLYLYAPPTDERPQGSWVHGDDVASALPSRLVLLVHGLDEPGGIWTELAPVLAERGYAAARFDYRNDDSIRACTAEMELALRELRQRGVEHVDIVGHSMGGLVARDVLTRESAYAGRGRGHEDLPEVGRLITIGTPNTGSIWAHLAPLSDLREHVARWMQQPGEPRHLLGFLVDGNGNAGDDLTPGSAYLEELNARGLPDVPITAVVASMTQVSDEDLQWLQSPKVVQALGEQRVRSLVESIKEAAAWVGDGVVCLDSARAVCIEDVVDVHANHRTMIRNFDWVVAAKRAMGKHVSEPPAIAVVLERLGTAGDSGADGDGR